MDDLIKVFEHEKFEIVEEKRISFCKMVCYFILSIVFLCNFLLTIEINKAYDINYSLKEVLQFTKLRGTHRFFPNINSKTELYYFILDTYLSWFYNENVKEFPNYSNNNHFVNGQNYFVGMRLTHKRADLKKIEYEPTGNVPYNVRITNYQGYTDSSMSYINKTAFGPENTTYSENGGFGGKGGFVHYFKPNMTYTDAFNMFTSLVEYGLLDEKLICMTFEMIFHNENYQTGVVVVIHEFIIENSGNLRVYEDAKFYHSSRYSFSYSQFTRQGFYYSSFFLTFIDIIYLAGFFWASWQFIKYIRSLIIEWKMIRTITIEFGELLNFIVLCLDSVIISYWIKIFIVFEMDTFPYIEESKFDNLINTSYDTYILINISSVQIMLLSLRNLRLLTTQFPSFGALFDTIKIAKIDLCNIFLVIIIIMVGFIFATMFLLGPHIDIVRTFPIAFNTILGEMLGVGNREDFTSDLVASYISNFLFIAVMVLFNFIILKLTVSIVIVRYKYLREKIQLDNMAKSRIVKSKTDAQLAKWKRLFLCRRPNNENQLNVDNVQNNQEISLKYIATTIRLNIDDITRVNKLQSKDERDQELIEMKKIILKEKLKTIKERQAMFSPENIKTHKSNFFSMLLYLIYLILFVVIIMMQINKKMVFDQMCVSTFIKNTTALDITATTIFNKGMGTNNDPNPFQFDDISDGEYIVDWMAELSKEYIFDSDPKIDGQNTIFGDPRMRITVRKYKQSSNGNPHSNTVIKNVTANNNYGLYSDLGEDEMTDTLVDKYGNKINYTANGNKNTALNKGGYVINIPANQTNPSNFIRSLYRNGTLDLSWAYVVFEFVYANRNMGSIIMNSIIFYNTPAGITEQAFNIYVFKRFYNSALDYFRACLELIFCLIFLYYFYKTIKAWILLYCEFTKKFLENQSPEIKRHQSLISRYIGIETTSMLQKGVFNCVYQCSISLVKCFIRSLYWMIASILKHSFSNIYILLDTVSISLTLMLIIMWIKIIANPQPEIDENGECDEVFGRVYDNAEYIIFYTQIYSINNLIRSIALMKYFQFSSKLSMFSEIMKSAQFDIIFFGLMFFIVMFGYSMAGNILFGIRNDIFSTLSDSLLTNFLYIIGAKSYDELDTLNDFGKYIYGVSYLILNLLLLNMFVAIIGSHYFEYYSDNAGNEEMSIIKLIVQILFSEEIKQKQLGIIENPPNEKCHHKMLRKLKLWIIEYILGDEFIDAKPEDDGIRIRSKCMLKDHYHPANQIINPEILQYINDSSETNPRAKDKERITRMTTNNQMDKLTFWMALLERTVDQYMSANYFPFLNDPDSILDEPTHKVAAALDLKYEEECMLNDRQISFAMMNMNQRIYTWNKLTKSKNW